MKLIFTKNEHSEISVMHKIGSNAEEFSYVKMIKNLISDKKLDEPELNGIFSDSEKESIISMITDINSEVEKFYSEEE